MFACLRSTKLQHSARIWLNKNEIKCMKANVNEIFIKFKNNS